MSTYDPSPRTSGHAERRLTRKEFLLLVTAFLALGCSIASLASVLAI